jgi:tRNA U54 and U55 pseudouridine synthase Pus10
VDLICYLWQQYVTTALLPLASSSVAIRREMVVFNNQTISRVEGAINNLLQRSADGQRVFLFTLYLVADDVAHCLHLLSVILSWLSFQLSKQKRTDFKPRNDDLSFARVNTEPCEVCCDTLERLRDYAMENLTGKNLEVFLTEIGIAFHK